METRNEIGIAVALRFTRVTALLSRAEAHMATLEGNAQLCDSRFFSQKAKKTKTSRLSHYNDGESISIDDHLEDFETEYESESSSLEEKDTRRPHKKKTRKKGRSNRPKKSIGGVKSLYQGTKA